MKKLLALMMALALVAFALPALAQDVNSNDISYNGLAGGNAVGSGNQQTNQFNGAVFGNSSNATLNNTNAEAIGNLSGNNVDSSTGFINKSAIVAAGNLSGNNVDSSTGAINKSIIAVNNSLSGNVAGNTNTTVNATLANSFNGNNLYFGNLEHAWQNQHQYEFQYDHQMNFPNTFYGSTDAIVYMPISNTHMEQANTGIKVGANAGSVGSGAVQYLADGANMSGMFINNQNMGGVGTNQAIVNAVTAFSAPAPQ